MDMCEYYLIDFCECHTCLNPSSLQNVYATLMMMTARPRWHFSNELCGWLFFQRVSSEIRFEFPKKSKSFAFFSWLRQQRQNSLFCGCLWKRKRHLQDRRFISTAPPDHGESISTFYGQAFVCVCVLPRDIILVLASLWRLLRLISSRKIFMKRFSPRSKYTQRRSDRSFLSLLSVLLPLSLTQVDRVLYSNTDF